MQPASTGATPGKSPQPDAADAPSNGRLSAGQRAVLDAVRAGAEDVDSICERTTLNAGFISASLTHLELAGAVTRLPGNIYRIRGKN
jgi:predicted Rossmann fold nucleotide-binding protein DprA/Smf involved in DNA uptake